MKRYATVLSVVAAIIAILAFAQDCLYDKWIDPFTGEVFEGIVLGAPIYKTSLGRAKPVAHPEQWCWEADGCHAVPIIPQPFAKTGINRVDGLILSGLFVRDLCVQPVQIHGAATPQLGLDGQWYWVAIGMPSVLMPPTRAIGL